jgi:hypothetical protein
MNVRSSYMGESTWCHQSMGLWWAGAVNEGHLYAMKTSLNEPDSNVLEEPKMETFSVGKRGGLINDFLLDLGHDQDMILSKSRRRIECWDGHIRSMSTSLLVAAPCLRAAMPSIRRKTCPGHGMASFSPHGSFHAMCGNKLWASEPTTRSIRQVATTGSSDELMGRGSLVGAESAREST